MERRKLLGFAATAASAGAVGLGAGYKFRDPIQGFVDPLLFPQPEPPPRPPTPREQFSIDAQKTIELQRRQTKETVLALKAKYESPVMGKVRVWDLLDKLALCLDPTDASLGCASQHMHVCQVIASLEESGELDETMLLTALLHDLGKVAMLAGEPPEHIVCFTEPIEGLEPAGGLDQTLFQFGHDEIA